MGKPQRERTLKENEARAVTRLMRVSPQKLNLLAQMIREQSLEGIPLALFTVNSIRESLPALARYVANHPRSEEIQVLLGTTFLHRGARRLGFDVSDMVCGPFYLRYKSWLFKLILANCHPDGWRRLKEVGHHLVPKRVYISKEKFFEQYLTPR